MKDLWGPLTKAGPGKARDGYGVWARGQPRLSQLHVLLPTPQAACVLEHNSGQVAAVGAVKGRGFLSPTDRREPFLLSDPSVREVVTSLRNL